MAEACAVPLPLMPPPAVKDLQYPISGSVREAIQNTLDEVKVKMAVVRKQKLAIDAQWQELRAIEAQSMKDLMAWKRISILPDAVVPFVNLLERAFQYHDFKETAKRRHDFKHGKRSKEDILRTFVRDEKLTSKFSRIGRREMVQAAHAIFWEVCHERDTYPTKPPYEDDALVDCIYNLVFQACQNGYEMDKDPVVELGKMISSRSFAYDAYFRIPQPPMKSSEEATKEAQQKYSQLVSSMIAKHKAVLEEKSKLTSSAANAKSRLVQPLVTSSDNDKVAKAGVTVCGKSGDNDKVARTGVMVRGKSGDAKAMMCRKSSDKEKVANAGVIIRGKSGDKEKVANAGVMVRGKSGDAKAMMCGKSSNEEKAVKAGVILRGKCDDDEDKAVCGKRKRDLPSKSDHSNRSGRDIPF